MCQWGPILCSSGPLLNCGPLFLLPVEHCFNNDMKIYFALSMCQMEQLVFQVKYVLPAAISLSCLWNAVFADTHPNTCGHTWLLSVSLIYPLCNPSASLVDTACQIYPKSDLSELLPLVQALISHRLLLLGPLQAVILTAVRTSPCNKCHALLCWRSCSIFFSHSVEAMGFTMIHETPQLTSPLSSRNNNLSTTCIV